MINIDHIMNLDWLATKLKEDKEYSADPHFALQGTIRWMRSLSIICNSESLSLENIESFYSGKNYPARVDDEFSTFACENLLMAIHNYSSLLGMKEVTNKSMIVISAIVSWYYSIYNSSKSMINLCSKKKPDTHTKTAKIYGSDLIGRDLIMMPFSYKIESVVPTDLIRSIEALRAGNTHNLNSIPTTIDEAIGGHISYLKGTAEYERVKREEIIKNSKAFKDLGVTNFRSKPAKELKDSQLSNVKINFLNQAFRYRGKAHYRDSIFLTYKDSTFNDEIINSFFDDLIIVSKTFLQMVISYIKKRIDQTIWKAYTDDVNSNNAIGFNFSLLEEEE